MNFPKTFFPLLTLLAFLTISSLVQAYAGNSKLFREYIGSQFTGVKFSYVPIINPDIQFHFILAFAVDYDTSSSPSPTNGNFNIFWDSENLSSSEVAAIKSTYSNVKVALSLGGDSVRGQSVLFKPSSVIDSWVANAVSSLTSIIQDYHLDGIDIDYEHFEADSETFAECIGKLITALKNNGVISFASIAPFDDEQVQSHYLALWKSYGYLIDYVNFQFYASDHKLSVSEFVDNFNQQASNYKGGQVLASFTSKGDKGLGPNDGFFDACKKLKEEGTLGGIFVWCADESQSFEYEKKSQDLLAA